MAERTVAERLRFAVATLGLLGLGALVTATGGAKSPILPVVVVPPMAAALAGGRARFVTFVSLAFVVVTFGVELLGSGEPAPVPRYATALLTALTGVFGTEVVRRARQKVELGRAESRRLHASAVVAVKERHAELVAVTGALAHQLKNPLAAVHGLATLLEKRASDEPELADLARDARALNVAVNELLDFSRPTSESSLKRIVLGVELARLAEPAGVRVATSGEVELAVLGEPRKLALVLGALLRAAARGDRAVTVEISRRGDMVSADIASTSTTSGGRELRMAKLLAEQHGAELEIIAGPTLHVRLAWRAAPEGEGT